MYSRFFFQFSFFNFYLNFEHKAIYEAKIKLNLTILGDSLAEIVHGSNSLSYNGKDLLFNYNK